MAGESAPGGALCGLARDMTAGCRVHEPVACCAGDDVISSMGGHHLILGKLTDFLTGEVLDDTLDERYRQKIARWLVEQKGYDLPEIEAAAELAAAGRSSTRRNQNRLRRPAGWKGRHGHPVRTGFAGLTRAPHAGDRPGWWRPTRCRSPSSPTAKTPRSWRPHPEPSSAAGCDAIPSRSELLRAVMACPSRLKPVAPAARGHGSSCRVLLRGRRRLPVRRHDMPAS
ncbi:MAG: hypothetical protein MZV70_06955 [Desulfobacterales bacterium]|nr:hypothetical protein [Desulfobacterales bacterium]